MIFALLCCFAFALPFVGLLGFLFWVDVLDRSWLPPKYEELDKIELPRAEIYRRER